MFVEGVEVNWKSFEHFWFISCQQDAIKQQKKQQNTKYKVNTLTGEA